MFELRKRSRSSGSYDQLSQEEDFEELVAAPLIRRRSPPPGKPPSTFCAKVCVVFCLMAIAFLSSIAQLLAIDSPYLQLSAKNMDRKPELVEGVLGAICLYIVCLLLACCAWWRGTRPPPPTVEDAD